MQLSNNMTPFPFIPSKVRMMVLDFQGPQPGARQSKFLKSNHPNLRESTILVCNSGQSLRPILIRESGKNLRATHQVRIFPLLLPGLLPGLPCCSLTTLLKRSIDEFALYVQAPPELSECLPKRIIRFHAYISYLSACGSF